MSQVTTRRMPVRRPPRAMREWAWPVAVGSFVTSVYCVYAFWQWTHLSTKSWDLAIFAQFAQRLARFEAPITPIKGIDFNLFGDHFDPLLVVLGPAYALWPHAYTLLVVQAACFGIGAGVITATARRLLGPVIGVLLGVALGFSWGLQYAAEAQFHEIALAIPLLSMALMALIERRWAMVVVAGGLTVFVKEDMGLTIAVLGAVLAWRSRERRHLWLTAWGAGWFLFGNLVWMPLFNSEGQWNRSGKLDVLGTITDPEVMFDRNKVLIVIALILIGAGIALRSPVALLLVPTLAWRFMSTDHSYWGFEWHYNAVLMPIACAALIDGVLLSRASPRAWLRGYSKAAAAVAVAAAAVLMPFLPLHVLVDEWGKPARADDARLVLAAVPEGASVETDTGLINYVVDDHTVLWLGRNNNPPPDCVLVDARFHGGTRATDVLAMAASMHPGIRYVLVHGGDVFQLACRDASASSSDLPAATILGGPLPPSRSWSMS